MNSGRKDFLRWKACERKSPFKSELESFQQGQRSYKCKYCGMWHRSGAFAKLVAKLNRKALK